MSENMCKYLSHYARHLQTFGTERRVYMVPRDPNPSPNPSPNPNPSPSPNPDPIPSQVRRGAPHSALSRVKVS